MTVNQAVESLHALRPLGLEGSIAELAHVGGALAGPVRMFRELFPGDYAKAVRREAPLTDALDRFGDLFDRQYFPISDAWGWSEPHEWTIGIPVAPHLSVNLWDVYGADDLTSPFRIAAFLLYGEDFIDPEAVWESLGWVEGKPDFFPREDVELSFETFMRLDELCGRDRTPARHFPLVIRIIDHATNNIWLDVSEETPLVEPIPWDGGSVEWLTGEWKAANRTWKRISQLTAWLDEDLATRTEHVLRLVLRATIGRKAA